MNSALPKIGPVFRLTISDAQWKEAIKKQSPPETPQFRYLSPDAFKMIEEQRIAFAPPWCFNDPFELIPHLKWEDRTVAKERTARIFKQNSTALPIAKNLPRRERRLQSRQLYRKFLNDWKSYQPQMNEEVAHSMQRDFPLGILCLSTTNKSLLMWSHYATSHTGLVIEFDVCTPDFGELGMFAPVRYSAERPIIHRDKMGMNATDEHFCTKSPEWDYEKEWRVFRPYSLCEHVETQDGVRYFAPLPKAAIKCIYLGFKSEESLQKRVMEFTRNTRIGVYQGRLSQSKFAINFNLRH